MKNYITCENISKKFKKNSDNVLDNININVEKGDFLVIGGENGSGKSTLLKIMIGLLLPDKGNVTLAGLNVKKDWKKLSKNVGVILNNERCLYWKLTAKENLQVFGSIYGVKKNVLKKRIPELLETVGLTDSANNLVETYSSGMRRKLMLCKALIHDPDLLFADELLNGVDPESCVEFIQLLEDLNSQGKTIIVISHILHNFPSTCKLVLLKQGKILLEDSISSIDVQKVIRLKYKLSNESHEETLKVDSFNKRITEVITTGATDIHVEHDNIYDITRRLLS